MVLGFDGPVCVEFLLYKTIEDYPSFSGKSLFYKIYGELFINLVRTREIEFAVAKQVELSLSESMFIVAKANWSSFKNKVKGKFKWKL